MVHFKQGETQPFDAIIACIGYSKDEIKIIEVDNDRFEDLRVSANCQPYTPQSSAVSSNFNSPFGILPVSVKPKLR